MSWSELRSWLIAYDIADPRRLQRVHACLKRHAIPVQFSVFVMRGDERSLLRILNEIKELINQKEDDIRAYHLPDRCEVIMLGCQSLPEGVLLPVQGLARLLGELTPAEGADIIVRAGKSREETMDEY